MKHLQRIVGYKGLILLIVIGACTYRAGFFSFKARLEQSINTNVNAVDQTFNNNLPVNSRDRWGNTPLMNAVINADYETVKKLVQDLNVDLNALANNTDKDPILSIACVNAANAVHAGNPEGNEENGALGVVRLLIDAGADVNKPSIVGLRPIQACMRVNTHLWRLHIMKMLVEAGAHINAQAADGSTVLHVSISANLPDWLRLLIGEFGQILNYDKTQIQHLDLRIGTPMTRYNATELADRLGKWGVDSIGEVLERRPKPLGWDGNLKITDSKGRTPLMLAMLRGDTKLVKTFIKLMKEKNISLAQKDPQGRTILMYAVMGDTPLVDVPLMLEDPAVKAMINDKDVHNNTALLLTTVIEFPSDRVQIANMLLRAGADIMAKDRFGRTLGERAWRLGDQDLVVWYKHKTQK